MQSMKITEIGKNKLFSRKKVDGGLRALLIPSKEGGNREKHLFWGSRGGQRGRSWVSPIYGSARRGPGRGDIGEKAIPFIHINNVEGQGRAGAAMLGAALAIFAVLVLEALGVWEWIAGKIFLWALCRKP